MKVDPPENFVSTASHETSIDAIQPAGSRKFQRLHPRLKFYLALAGRGRWRKGLPAERKHAALHGYSSRCPPCPLEYTPSGPRKIKLRPRVLSRVYFIVIAVSTDDRTKNAALVRRRGGNEFTSRQRKNNTRFFRRRKTFPFLFSALFSARFSSFLFSELFCTVRPSKSGRCVRTVRCFPLETGAEQTRLERDSKFFGEYGSRRRACSGNRRFLGLRCIRSVCARILFGMGKWENGRGEFSSSIFERYASCSYEVLYLVEKELWNVSFPLRSTGFFQTREAFLSFLEYYRVACAIDEFLFAIANVTVFDTTTRIHFPRFVPWFKRSSIAAVTIDFPFFTDQIVIYRKVVVHVTIGGVDTRNCRNVMSRP